MAETYRVGLLGHGTVGAAFEQLLERARGARSRTSPARKPEVTGVLTRSRGDFDEILADCDLIVELIGGIEPARDYVLRAMRAGKHVVSANKLLLASHGEELWEHARASTTCSCASRAPWPASCPVIRVLQESLAAAHVERIHGIVNGTTNFILTEMARGGTSVRAPRSRRAQELGLRRGRPDRRRHRPRRRGQDGDPRPARVLHAGPPRPGRSTRASSTSRAEDVAYARDLGLGAEADRHRRARRRRHQRPRAPRVPVSRATRWRPSTARSTPSPSSRRRSPRSRCPARAPAARRPRAPCSATSSAR